MSKMREALEAAIDTRKKSVWPTARIVNELISRYGDLEFTREEMREAMANSVAQAISDPAGMYDSIQIIDRILSRHTEAEDTREVTPPESVEQRLDMLESLAHKPADFGPRFDVIEKRLAAIEKRVLADGHHEDCDKGANKMNLLPDYPGRCTCGHDEIRENRE